MYCCIARIPHPASRMLRITIPSQQVRTNLTNRPAADTLPKAQGAGDAFILRNILHDWSDADCIAILKVRGSNVAGKRAAIRVYVS